MEPCRLGNALTAQQSRRQLQHCCPCQPVCQPSRLPVHCTHALANRKLQQQHAWRLTPCALPEHSSSRGSGTPVSSSCDTHSRRTLLLSGTALVAAVTNQACWSCKPAQGYLVDEAAAQSVFALASRSVVSINDYRNQGGAELLEGIGTGFVWDQYGHVVTNYHVISKYVLDKSGKQSVKVVLGDGSSSSGGSGIQGSSSSGGSGGLNTYQARIIGTDAMHDLAVLQIDAPRDSLAPIRMGTSGDLKVGQSVYAIGNPNGLSKTLTAGVVSGLNRTIPAPTGTRIYGAIQTDANINAGNSGGPLLDSFARLVGVNTASFTRSGSGRGSGVNFALPADLVFTIVPNLIVYGTAAGKGVRSG